MCTDERIECPRRAGRGYRRCCRGLRRVRRGRSDRHALRLARRRDTWVGGSLVEDVGLARHGPRWRCDLSRRARRGLRSRGSGRRGGRRRSREGARRKWHSSGGQTVSWSSCPSRPERRVCSNGFPHGTVGDVLVPDVGSWAAIAPSPRFWRCAGCKHDHDGDQRRAPNRRRSHSVKRPVAGHCGAITIT